MLVICTHVQASVLREELEAERVKCSDAQDVVEQCMGQAEAVAGVLEAAMEAVVAGRARRGSDTREAFDKLEAGVRWGVGQTASRGGYAADSASRDGKGSGLEEPVQDTPDLQLVAIVEPERQEAAGAAEVWKEAGKEGDDDDIVAGSCGIVASAAYPQAAAGVEHQDSAAVQVQEELEQMRRQLDAERASRQALVVGAEAREMQLAAEARELKERLSRADKEREEEREEERERVESLLVVLEQLRVSGAPLHARSSTTSVSPAWQPRFRVQGSGFRV